MSVEAYQKRRAAQSRAAVLAAAEEGFVRSGFERTTLADVARRAGVSSATVYKHFSTKQMLFEAVLDGLAADAVLELPPDPLTRERLTEYARRYALLLVRPRSLALLRLLIAEAPHHPELVREFYERLKKPLFAPLVGALGRRLDPGDESVGIAARQLASMIEGHLLMRQLLDPESAVDAAHREAVVEAAIDTWWRTWSPRLRLLLDAP